MTPTHTTADVNGLFPLPLVPFERYMIADDGPQYPMEVLLRLQVEGNFHRELLDHALTLVLPRHPLLQARLEGRSRTLRWVACPRSESSVRWATGEPLEEAEWRRPLDLAREPGLRVTVWETPGATVLLLKVHHACCDAIGAVQLASELLAAYADLTRSDTHLPSLPELTPFILRHRAYVAPPEGPLPKTTLVERLWGAVREAWKVFARFPVPIATPAKPLTADLANAALGYPELLVRRLSQADTDHLRQVARKRNVSVNDLLLCDLFLALHSWNKKSGRYQGDQWFRVTMPTNLRSGELGVPTVCRIGYAFLTRRSRDCEDADALLASLVEETRLIKRWRLGSYFLAVIEFLTRLPGALRLVLRSSRCFSTVILSNVGDPEWHFTGKFECAGNEVRFGPLILKEVVAVPPIRAGTRIGLLVSYLRDGLSIGMRCDSRHISASDAERFLDLFVQSITHTADQAVEPVAVDKA